MPKAKYDLNDNGKIDPDEREIMLDDRRRQVLDADAKRDAQRRMAWFSLTGMLVFIMVLQIWDQTNDRTIIRSNSKPCR